MNDSFARAYTEVLVILNNLPKEEYEKIPKEEIKFYQDNCDKEYHFELNKNIRLENQKISKKANAILVILFRDYIATDRQKEKLKEILHYNTLQKEKIAREKYNPDNLFKKKETEQLYEEKNNGLIEYKKTWINVAIDKIKSVLKKIFSN